MSWKPEVMTDSSGKWYGNAIRLATEDEARDYVHDLMRRWTLVWNTRVIEVDEPAEWRFVDGKLEEIR